MQHMQSKQIELGSSKHLPLDQLQAIDLAFDRPVAPGFGDGRLHGENVALQSGLEILDQSDPGRSRAGHPLM